MHISKVRTQNFRSIIDASFEVPQLCVLIGPNNSGKSNVLTALNIVLGDRWPTVRAFDDRDHYGYETERDIVISVWFDEPREVRGDVGEHQEYTGIEFRLTRYKRRSGRHEAGDSRSLFYCIDDEGDQVEILRMPPSGNRPYSTPASVSSDIREGLPAVFIDFDRSATYHLSGSQRSILGRLLKRVAKDFHSDEDRVAQFNQEFERARQYLRTEEFLSVRDTVVEHLRAHTGMDDIDVILDDVDPMNIYQTFSILFQDSETPAPVDAKRMGTGIQSAVVIAILQTFRDFERQDRLMTIRITH
ncbi:MAG: AAA family ATPase [Anaerolineales bacterium]